MTTEQDIEPIDRLKPVEIDEARVKPLMSYMSLVPSDDGVGFDARLDLQAFTQGDDDPTAQITLYSLGAPTGKTYEIKTLEDLFSIPPERFADFVAALISINAHGRAMKRAALELGGEFRFVNPESGIRFVDDGNIAGQIALTIESETPDEPNAESSMQFQTMSDDQGQDGTRGQDGLLQLYVIPDAELLVGE